MLIWESSSVETEFTLLFGWLEMLFDTLEEEEEEEDDDALLFTNIENESFCISFV